MGFIHVWREDDSALQLGYALSVRRSFTSDVPRPAHATAADGFRFTACSNFLTASSSFCK